MTFIDILYGRISFSDIDESALVHALIATPEVQRLRFLRLLNHDAPFLQELATARRFAHSIGSCFAAFLLLRSAPWISTGHRREVLAAALIHDIGILPYGHLVERELSRVMPGFSHESLVSSIVWGTYHQTNVWHQILPDASLKVATVLRRFGVDPERVLSLICPAKGSESPVAGAIDLDNIDNIHRMAALMGRMGARKNLRSLLNSVGIDEDLQLVFQPTAVPNIRRWLKYREMIYTHMIGHPSCVAYNAFLQDVARQAVAHQVITQDTWFLNDVDFEAKMLGNKELLYLTAQLRSGCRYRLLDYAWIQFAADGVNQLPADAEARLLVNLGDSPVEGGEHRIWVERDKVSRLLRLRVSGHHNSLILGKRSSIVLIALIDPGRVTQNAFARFRVSDKERWRERLRNLTQGLFPQHDCSFLYPESFTFGGMRSGATQLDLFSTTT